VNTIGLVQGQSPEGVINGAVARPLLLGWEGMMWEPKRAMNSGSMNTQEARILPLKWEECQSGGCMEFIADEMLGKLAKWLRILGVSVITDLGEGDFDNLALKVAEERNCVILTRDEDLFRRAAKRKIRAELVPEDPIRALAKISAKYGIKLEIDLDKTRCPLCNTPLRRVKPEEAVGKVPEPVVKSGKQIFFCSRCNKYYWTGTHYENILSELEMARSLREADDERRRE